MLETWFLSLLEVTLLVSFFYIILILFRTLIVKRYQASWRRTVWLLLVLRLVLPFNFSLSAAPRLTLEPLIKLVYGQSAETEKKGDTSGAAANNNGLGGNGKPESLIPGASLLNGSSRDEAGGLNPQGPVVIPLFLLPEQYEEGFAGFFATPLKLVALMWAGGVMIGLFYQAALAGAIRRRIRIQGKEVENAVVLNALEEAKTDIGWEGPLKVVLWDQAPSPMAAGLRRSVLVLPRENYKREQLAFILRHELVHLKQKDIAIKLLLLGARLLHWFNPLVHLMARTVEEDMELACDEEVLKNRDGDYRIRYGQTLVDLLKADMERRKGLAAAFSGGGKAMKTRLEALAQNKTRKKGLPALILMAAFMAAGGLMVACGPQNVGGVPSPVSTTASPGIQENSPSASPAFTPESSPPSENGLYYSEAVVSGSEEGPKAQLIIDLDGSGIKRLFQLALEDETGFLREVDETSGEILHSTEIFRENPYGFGYVLMAGPFIEEGRLTLLAALDYMSMPLGGVGYEMFSYSEEGFNPVDLSSVIEGGSKEGALDILVDSENKIVKLSSGGVSVTSALNEDELADYARYGNACFQNFFSSLEARDTDGDGLLELVTTEYVVVALPNPLAEVNRTYSYRGKEEGSGGWVQTQTVLTDLTFYQPQP